MQTNLTAGRAVRVLKFDWSDINTTGYNVAPIRVYTSIHDEIVFQQSRGVAATRVDIFGHSAGGTIVKWYVSDIPSTTLVRNLPSPDGFPDLIWDLTKAPFRRANNFNVGDIRRFVSVGDPFRGSIFAATARGELSYSAITIALIPLWLKGLHKDGTAIDDLSITSRATLLLATKTPVVSWLPIVGIAHPKPETSLVPYGWDVLLSMIGATPSGMGLDNTTSDWVVINLSAVDRGAGPFPPIGRLCKVAYNTVHTEEPTDPTGSILAILLQAFDLQYTSSTDAGYIQGYTLFNTSF